MKELFNRFTSPSALSAAAGGARLLAILMGALALAGTAALLFLLRPGASAGHGIPLLYLLDEMDDALEVIVMLAAGSAGCACLSRMLRRRSRAATAELESVGSTVDSTGVFFFQKGIVRLLLTVF